MKAEGYHELFGEVYRYLDKHLDCVTEEDWVDAARELGPASRKHYGTDLGDFCVALYVAVYKEMERRYKKRRDTEETPQASASIK